MPATGMHKSEAAVSSALNTDIVDNVADPQLTRVGDALDNTQVTPR
jgi:hypothetical protein